MDAYGIDRNRTYTREELCRRYGYDPESMPDKTPEQKALKRTEERNRNRFFREHFLKRRPNRTSLPAVAVGKTFEVSGEIFHAWTTANSRMCADDDPQIQAGQAVSK